MTLEEMLDIWERAAAGLEATDYDAWLDAIDPRIEFITLEGWPDGGVYRGPEAVWDFLREFVSVFSAGRFEVLDPVPVDQDRLVLTVRRLTAGDQSGAQVEFTSHAFVTFRNGRLRAMSYYETREAALAAAGGG